MENLNILSNKASSDFLTFQQLRDRKPELYGTISGDVATGYNSYIEDAISECADAAVDIYYEDLKNYYFDHEEECTNALKELGYEMSQFDTLSDAMYKGAQCAEFQEYEQEAYDELDNIYAVHAINYILDNNIKVTNEQLYEILQRIADEIDSGDRFDDIDLIVDEVTEPNEAE